MTNTLQIYFEYPSTPVWVSPPAIDLNSANWKKAMEQADRLSASANALTKAWRLTTDYGTSVALSSSPTHTSLIDATQPEHCEPSSAGVPKVTGCKSPHAIT